jgi:uncharacterized iron-regulated membrane protein
VALISKRNIDQDSPAREIDHDENSSIKTSRTGLFAAFWRWHFFASLVVIPVFAMLAVTGMIHMFRFDIWNLRHPGVMYNSTSIPADSQFLPIETQAAAALNSHPDLRVTGIVEPFGNRNTRIFMKDGEDTLHDVYVNPFTGNVTGEIIPSREFTDLAIRLHGNLTKGKFGDGIIELAACWAIVMALTGYYMYFRNRKSRLVYSPISKEKNRHALVGFAAGFGILFLVISGLPWTGFWGDTLQTWASGKGLHISLWGNDPGAASDFGTALKKSTSGSQPAPWALGESQLPRSNDENIPSIGLDSAISVADRTGLPHPYLVLIPDGKEGVYSVMADSWSVPDGPAFKDVSKEAVVHIDQYSGTILATYGYDKYSLTAKLVDQGVSIHEGRKLGVVTRISSTSFCLAILFLCVTGPIMWWKRRPKAGGLSAPRGRLPISDSPVIAITLIVLGVVLPLFGASLLVVLIFDKFLIRRIPSLMEKLNSKIA